MAWDEAFDWAGVGPLIKLFEALPVNQQRPALSTFKVAHGVLERDRLLGIFFEGGRSGGFGLNEPMPGATRIALRANTAVIPVSVSGLRRVWPLKSALPLPGPVVIR